MRGLPSVSTSLSAGSSTLPGGMLPRSASSTEFVVSSRWKFIFAVVLQQLLDPLRVPLAGQLDQDAVLPLGDDGRFLHAGLVDAAPHDLDRLRDRLATLLDQVLLIEAERDERCPARR